MRFNASLSVELNRVVITLDTDKHAETRGKIVTKFFRHKS